MTDRMNQLINYNLLILHDPSPEKLYQKGITNKVVYKFEKIANNFNKTILICSKSKRKIHIKNVKTVYIHKYMKLFLSFYILFYVLKYKINIFRVYEPSFYALAALPISKLLNVPMVTSLHGEWNKISKGYPKWMKIKGLIEPLIIKNSDYLTSTSHSLASYAKRRGGKKVVEIPTWGCDTKIFKNNNKHKSNSLKINVIYIGRISPEKRLEYIIHTIYFLKKISKKKLKFYIIGPGDDTKNNYFNKIKDLCRAFNIEKFILFTGGLNQKKLPSFYKKADCLLMTSITEGLPHPILEALSMNIPVVSSSVGDVKILIKNGRNGYKFNINTNPKTVAKLIIKAKNLKVKKEYGRNLILNGYSKESSVKKEIEIYNKMLSK